MARHKITVDEITGRKEFEFYFSHDILVRMVKVTHKGSEGTIRIVTPITICHMNLDGKEVLGITEKHPKDRENRVRARKEATKKSLENLGLTKAEKTSFWDAYKTMFRYK